MERSVVIAKPDAIQRRLLGRIVTRLEDKGLRLVGMKMVELTDDVLTEHYGHLRDEPFFDELIFFMSSTPSVAMCWEGVDCVSTLRSICGVTKARDAAPGTIRGDMAMSVQTNLIHTADSVETAQTEIRRFFSDSELFDYESLLTGVTYTSRELQM